MKKRGSLVFALCAMVGAVTIACSDDSGDKVPSQPAGDLTVLPDSMTLTQGQSDVINVTYGSKKDLVITSEKPDCVKVDGGPSKEATTNAEGKLTVNATAVGEDCTSIVTVMDKDDSTISKNVNVKVLGAGEEMPILTLTPDSLSLTPGGSDTAVANYKMEQSGTPIANRFLELSSTNPACANPASTSVETDASGNADIKVIANDGGACNAMITVKPPEGTSKSINVSVSEGDEPGPGPVVPGATMAFDPTSLSIAFSEKTGNIVLNYKDGNGAGVANANVTFDYNDECVKSDKLKKAKTDDNGQIAMVLTAQKEDCTTTLTAKSGDVTASAEITVTAKTEFSFTLETAIEESKYDKIGYLAVGTSDQSCAALAATEAGLQGAAETIVDEQAELNGVSPILSTYPMTKIPIAKKSVLAVGKANSSAKVTKAYGCKDISAADDGQTVHLDLEYVYAEIKGTYSVVTNFDFTSTIEGTDAKRLENMSGNDWLKFLFDFFDDPVSTLFSFVWNNSVDRLKDIDNETVKTVVNFILGKETEETVKSLVKDFLENYLKTFTFNFEGADKPYYDLIVKDISPIVSDLSRNMQLFGTMEISETDGVSAISKGSEKFSEIQYIWPFNANKACVPNVYSKSDVKCRNRMLLEKANGGNLQSDDWTGTWADDKLNINAHSLNFKWASILASVIVIEILPSIFDYKGYSNYKDGNYFSALIDRFLFDLIIDGYNKKNEEDSKNYPELDKGTNITSCARAIESLVYLLAAEKEAGAGNKASGYGNTIITVANDYVCKFVNKLDDYVWDALGKVEASTNNLLTLETKDCALSEVSLAKDDQENPFEGYYTRMGIPDEPVVTAHEVFGDSKKSTSRCTWDLKIGDMNKPMKGLFHSTRTK